MEINKQTLNTIFEEESSSEHNNSENVYVEITYFPDNMPSIKSYYVMNQNEYKDLKTIYLDLYIDDFINEEELTKDKIDIHIINNPNNIKLCKEFLKIFGNPFDILTLISEKKKVFELNQKKFSTNKQVLSNNFSDTSDSETSNKNSDDNNLDMLMGKTNKKTLINSESESDSEDYIATMTEIIETFNKTKNVDELKLKKLTESKPDTLFENIIGEIAKSATKKSTK